MEMRLVQEQFDGQSFILAVFNNMTSLKRTEKALAESSEQVNRAVSATEDGIWEWNVPNNSVSYSARLKHMIGKQDEDEVSFEDWFEHIHPDHRSKVQAAIDEHFATKAQYYVEYLGRDHNNQYAWFSAVGNSTFDPQGKPLLMSGALRNIHHKKSLELQVAEKNKILNAIYDGASQAIWQLKVEPNYEFRFLEFNKLACQRTGVTFEQVENKTLSELRDEVFDADLVDKIAKNYRLCVDVAKPIDYTEMIPHKQCERWYQTTLYPLKNNQGEVEQIVGIAVDITARKAAEQELEKNQRFLQRIIDSAVCGLYLYDLKQARTTKINKRYTQLVGYQQVDLAATNIDALFHPSEFALVEAHIEEVKASEDGQLLPLKYRFKHKTGHWMWCYAVDTVLTRDSNGNPELMLSTFVDMTEQTELLIKLQESNAQLEQFAYLASHDLQEPLRKITAFSDSLAERITPQLPNCEDAKFELERLVSASQRMRTMIKIYSSYAFTRPSTKITRHQSQYYPRRCLWNTQFSIEESHTEITLQHGDIMVQLDASLFIQVLQNLISNSIKFKREECTPHIRINCEQKGQQLVIHYQDNGIGIPASRQQQIFEPFKRFGGNREQGSGIGLSLCKEIIKLHGGTVCCINCDSGALFKITLPRQAKES